MGPSPCSNARPYGWEHAIFIATFPSLIKIIAATTVTNETGLYLPYGATGRLYTLKSRSNNAFERPNFGHYLFTASYTPFSRHWPKYANPFYRVATENNK